MEWNGYNVIHHVAVKLKIFHSHNLLTVTFVENARKMTPFF